MTTQKTIIIISILLITSVLTALATHTENIAPNKSFNEFPLNIGSWQGKASQLDEKIYNILGVEDYIMADFRNSPGKVINLYVGFYQSQKQGDLIHSPKNCLPGAGWNIIDSAVIPIDLDTPILKKTKVIKLLLAKGGQQQVVLYWFQSRGRIIASEYMQKIWLVVDSITKNRTDGSFIRLISPVIKDEDTATNLLKEFATQLYPILNEYIPS